MNMDDIERLRTVYEAACAAYREQPTVRANFAVQEALAALKDAQVRPVRLIGRWEKWQSN